jgi:hypothetical protein
VLALLDKAFPRTQYSDRESLTQGNTMSRPMQSGTGIRNRIMKYLTIEVPEFKPNTVKSRAFSLEVAMT